MRITDPRAIRALAHPLRLDLIELLSVEGPATAAACARALDSSQASCSFHLRQLAKYGVVEPAPGGRDRRARPWQLTDVEQSWSADDADAAGGGLKRVLVRREADRILRWAASRAGEPGAWRSAGFFGGATVRLTADEVHRLREGLRSLLDPYVERLADRSAEPSGARDVRIVLAGTPLPVRR
jgi:predicted ArsR family transcriptional regulator